MNIQNSSAFAATLLALVLAAGCDRKDDAKIATQVAARVNADEITVHQVNQVLGQRQDIKPEFAAQAKRAVLDRLINQQLARQEAIEAQLDRSPEVEQTIEAAKTEILARAHVDGINRTLRFLFNQVSGAAVTREMGEIRKQSTIEYFGKFVDRSATAETKKGEAEVKSFTEAEAKAEADAQARSQDAAGKQGQK